MPRSWRNVAVGAVSCPTPDKVVMDFVKFLLPPDNALDHPTKVSPDNASEKPDLDSSDFIE